MQSETYLSELGRKLQSVLVSGTKGNQSSGLAELERMRSEIPNDLSREDHAIANMRILETRALIQGSDKTYTDDLAETLELVARFKGFDPERRLETILIGLKHLRKHQRKG